MKLDIGCGNQKAEGYIGIDPFIEGADCKAQMWELPYQDNEVEGIYSSHALEHAPMGKVQPTLKEWFRVLKPGGTLLLQVPNMDYVARYWLTGPDRTWAEAMAFGNQEHEGEFHKCGFTPMGLQGDLQQCGFIVDQVALIWAYNQETLQARARKPE